MSSAEMAENPLLNIDTDFRSYLNAYTRSFRNHVIDGQLDYAFDSDFAVRQKIVGLSGWNKLAKAINTTDVTAEAKNLFTSCERAGSLKFAEIYDILKRCCERLELALPIVLIRKDFERPLIYSISTDMIDPCIIISEKLIDICNEDELEMLIGGECGRIQNNHCTYSWAYTYLNHNTDTYRPTERSYKGTVNTQIVGALAEWIHYSDMTADRASMICMTNPGRFTELFCGLFEKGYVDFFGRGQLSIRLESLRESINRNKTVAARNLSRDTGHTELERRAIASAEFLSCESLFTWRTDIEPPDTHKFNSEVCDVRCSIILSGGQ